MGKLDGDKGLGMRLCHYYVCYYCVSLVEIMELRTQTWSLHGFIKWMFIF